MAKKRGRPPKVDSKTGVMQIRLELPEKKSFEDAAALAGQKVSVWVRDRLRQAAQRELKEAGRPIAFLDFPEADRGVE